MLDDPYVTATPMPWMAEGAPAARCVDTDADAWFPEAGGSARQETKLARLICRECPLQAQCRDWAVSERIGFGIYGDTSPAERRVLLRERRAA